MQGRSRARWKRSCWRPWVSMRRDPADMARFRIVCAGARRRCARSRGSAGRDGGRGRGPQDRVRQRARGGAVRLRARRAARQAGAGPLARAAARALHAQHGAVLRDRPPAALHDPRRRPAPRRQRVRRRDELGDRRDRGRAAAARDRARHDRAPRRDARGCSASRASRPASRALGERALAGRRRRRPRRRGGRADARDAAAAARRDRSATARRWPPGATGGEPTLRFEIRTGEEVFGEICASSRASSARTRRTSCAASPTCWRPRWGGCAARSRCATRRCTTR